MEAWTLGAIVVGLTFITTLIATVRKLVKEVTDAIAKVVKQEIKPLEAKLDDLASKLDDVDLNSSKNFLVARFGEIERGEVLDAITRQRVYEEYGHYMELGGNSYIHSRFEELKRKGCL